MTTRIYVDGAIEDQHARVPVLDRGFLYGDSVYEVARTSGGRPVDLEPHLDRLERSAARLAIELPARAQIGAAVAETLAAAANPESYIRVIVTRGGGEIGLDPALADRPRLIVIVGALVRPPAELYQRGASLRVVGVERNNPRALDPSIKSGNYLNNVLALAEARRAGAYEAILCDERGRVTEGSSSNVWCVTGGRVATPPTAVGLLPGITRWRLLGLARAAGIAVDEVELTADQLRTADEVWLTSSVRGVLPVSKVDDRVIAIGSTARRMMALYDQYLAAVADGRPAPA